MRAITTNGGKTRFNPNIYNEGKVCLSILGTWRGEPGEEWSSAQGLESILLSVQSLMSSNPYENEPGYERSSKEKPMPQAYVEKIRHETLRIAVIQRLEGLLGMDSNGKSVANKDQDIEDPYGAPLKQNWASSGDDYDGDDADGGASSSNSSTHEYDADAACQDEGVWDPFADLIKRRFLWYYDSYSKTIETNAPKVTEGKAFTRMEFEYPPNSM